ncbi:DUF1648 domain-containing protein [Parabacteroides sp. OttesenSCG-928-G07]|nr:DUF1648 domain-containing protein [Parabacteroides sp. OttesenSCG-928-G21]MDL2278609.1 DUF1648 domain-containing protein [Parabacteroides sp. OttesenSCG-928-G07]
MKRPRLKIGYTKTDIVVEMACWICLFLVWVLFFMRYSGLPETVPTHYDAAGKIDAFGNKETLWSLPVMCTLFCILLSLVNFFPHLFNYPEKITQENAYRQYRNASQMLRYLKLFLTLTLGYILYQATSYDPNETSQGLGVWFLPVFIIPILVFFVYFYVRTHRLR